MKYFLVYGITIGWLVLLAVACNTNDFSYNPGIDQAVMAFPVQVTKVEPKDLDIVVLGAGNLHAAQKAELTTLVDGRIELQSSGNIKLGAELKRGDVLAAINNDSYRLQLKKAELSLEQNKYTIERLRRAVEGKVTPMEQLKQAEFSLRAAELEVNDAQLLLNKAVISSPIDGTITYLAPLVTGQTVTSGQKLAVIETNKTMLLTIAAPVSQRHSIAVGQPATIRLEGFDDLIFQGKVSEIGLQVDVTDLTVAVTIEIDNPDGTLLSGMYAAAEIVTEHLRQVPAVPKRALIHDGTKTYIYALTSTTWDVNLRAIKKEIEIGKTSGDFVQVSGGLEVGEEVVTSETQGLQMGSYVKVLQ